ncbi:MAG: hydrogenase [Methylacidiphilales bacterium]|nr:hydrogenase [Candidatus Methylacidiphilales bacterium]
MSYFTPSTKPTPPRYDLLALHEEVEVAKARQELVREPYVNNERNAAWVGDHIASVVENPAPLWWYIAVSIAGSLAGLTGIGILYLICTGVGVWGENKAANWAWDITNFVFWIGIGHAGTMIAAILYLTRQKWASGINRAAEAMTIFAVMCAGVFPAVHVGRVWLAWYMAPIPNANGIWPNFRSPLLWDVFAVNTYLAVSIMFWYVGLIPDAASMRDRIKNKVLKYIYAVICLGWRGSARQWANYEFCYLMLAGIATLLVITTCTVVSSDFSTSVIPGWHGTIFIPYFGVGAIYGGFCMLIILLVPIRQLYKLEDLVTLRHIDLCCRFTLLMGLFVTYIYGMEFFIAYYGGNPNERFTFYNRVCGPYWKTWIVMMICNCGIPMLFWSRKWRRNPWGAFVIVLFPSVGMWLERFVIIVSSVHRDFLPSSWGMFYPTWIDVITFTGTFGIFSLLYLLFIRFLPVIAMAEVRSVLPEANPHEAPTVVRDRAGAGGSHE